MRVLMVNRADAYTVSGGDTVQMEKTRQALANMGISLDVHLGDNLISGLSSYDLVHLFNIQTNEQSWRVCEMVLEYGLPILLSPIYWDPVPGWFNRLKDLKPVWRWLPRIFGHRISYAVFSRWQRFRYPKQEHWQEQRRILEAVKLILPNSQIEADQIRRDFRLGAKTNMQVIPNAIEPSLFDPLPAPSPKFIGDANFKDGFILQVGRVSPEKNNLALIQALWDVNLPIVFVGKPSPYDAAYYHECHNVGQKRGKVFFINWVPYHELPAIYAAATVHVLPSWRETPGLVSLEAAAANCRVVSTKIGSVYEYFGDDIYYCDPSDINSIYNAVQSSLASPPSNALRERILENFTWEIAAQKTLAAYHQVVSSR